MMLNATPELRINLHEFTKVGALVVLPKCVV